MRIIAHLDMDAFFASIEERDNPRLRGRPIVVGADPKEGVGRGVVSTANYAARKYGIRSALPISTAWRFSEIARRKGLPPAIFLDVDMKKYATVSRNVMEIVRKYATHVEEASVDEAYLDLSAAGSYEKAIVLAQKIKDEIKARKKLTASVGIGPNKLIAKIASDRKKPDGLTIVSEEDAEKFLEPLSVRAIPGVGPKAEEKFKAMGIITVGDAKRLELSELEALMGKWGVALYDRLRARDDSPLAESWTAKSIGEQETFERDTLDANFLEKHLQKLSEEVFDQFSESEFKIFRAITITVRFSDFRTLTRTTTLRSSNVSKETMLFHALRLFMPFLDARENPERKSIRLIGVRVEKLE